MTNDVLVEDDKELQENLFDDNWVGKLTFWLFHFRKPLLILFILITIVLGALASRLSVQAAFTKMIPLKHEYMQTFVQYADTFGGANKILISLKNSKGDIYNKPFMDKLRAIHEEVFYLNGVERSKVTSLFSSNVRYTEVVEDGFTGDVIISSDFAGTDEQLGKVKVNVLKSDWVGRIVARDMSAAMVVATLQDNDPETGKRLDLQEVAKKLEAIRVKYENDGQTVQIIGFAKSVGDIASGAAGVLVFFAIAFVLTTVLLYWYSGSGRITALAIICAVVPVIWLLGLLPVFGLGLDPMSILVPFLIFSIGVSHAVQMTSAWKLETIEGHDGVTASRLCVQKLFIPGAMALVANALGFMVIGFVEIEMVHELALTATIGVTVMIVTNKMLLPILLSYLKFKNAAKELKGNETSGFWLWEKLGALAEPKAAAVVLAISAALLAGGLYKAADLKIGDLGKGVPELKESARYNRDVEVITKDFALGVDVLQVIAEHTSKESPCVQRDVMDKMEEFELAMRQVDGVATVRSIGGFVKLATQNYAETAIKWRMLPEETAQIAQGTSFATRFGPEFMNSTCSSLPINIFTSDHQATTITRIIDQIRLFKEKNDSDEFKFRLASGNVGVMAATNEAVHAADKWVNLALFASVAALCMLEFKSLMVTLCIILPLGLVTILCNAVMASLNIGLKVNTLPVVALGVGVGVDYGIYLFERMKHEIADSGLSLRDAFVSALKQRGTASVFTAVTMTLSVTTWLFSDLKFQADMGLLLAFMFLVNMFAAILVLPALAAFLVGERMRGKH